MILRRHESERRLGFCSSAVSAVILGVISMYISHFYCPNNTLNYTNLEVKIYVV
jgi:hypothetical protein